jgi:hypothetical protein
MLKKIKRFLRFVKGLESKLNFIHESLGRIESRQLLSLDYDIKDTEFKVYSQSGEDGIIQYLVNKINIEKNIFIEFGVENYLESNTRFLALNNYWSGLVIDGDIENITFIKKDPIYWRSNIKAECSFITKENINDIFEKNGITGDIGLLSVDIDGNDYWVWEAINSVNPAIIVAEYNSFFGLRKKVTVPYDPDFVRSNAHSSKIYYGASIAALTALANKRGYKLVASNKSGNNVFYVREDLMGDLKEISNREAYRRINFREAHNSNGELIFTDFESARKLIYDLKVFDIDENKEVTIKSLWI